MSNKVPSDAPNSDVTLVRGTPVHRYSSQARWTTLVGVLSCAVLASRLLKQDSWSHSWPLTTLSPRSPHTAPTSCKPLLPDIFTSTPPSPSHPLIQSASRDLETQLSKRFEEGDIESLAIAVVTSEGSIYEGTFGVVRANETDEVKRGRVTRDTVYRLASVSKVFTTLETMILRDRGVLQW